MYRISGRLHANYTSAGTQNICEENYSGVIGTTRYIYNYQSNHSSGYECHMFDNLVHMDGQKQSYFRFYGNSSYSQPSSAQFDEICASPVLFTDYVGCWRSGAAADNYKRWNFEEYGNPRLYNVIEDGKRIEVKQNGYYRISASIATYFNGAAQAILYINGNQYCISIMGAYGTTYYSTHFINEIVRLDSGDKIGFFVNGSYDSRDYNSLFMEKLVVEQSTQK